MIEDNLNWIDKAEREQKKGMLRYKKEWNNLGGD